jgi:hypothetical protein
VVLEQNYPNPWLAGSDSRYNFIPVFLPTEGIGRLRIYDSQGKVIITLLQGRFSSGKQTLVWDGRTANGVDVAPGVYIIRLEFEGEVFTRRISLLR